MDDKWLLPVGACLIIALAGCGSAKDASKANFEKVVNAHYAKDCILVRPGDGLGGAGSDFPVTVELREIERPEDAKRNEELTREYAALVKAGLLTEEDTTTKSRWSLGKDRIVPARRYSLTDEGKTFYQAERKSNTGRTEKPSGFCAGHYVVDEIKRFTEPGNMGPYTISEVSYTFSPQEVPAWAKDAVVQESVGKLKERLVDGQAGKATLIKTNEGWVHERDFQD
jgi:hypothetical protein